MAQHFDDNHFTLGIEEEYLLVDRDTYDLAEAPPGLMEACAAELAGKSAPSFSSARSGSAPAFAPPSPTPAPILPACAAMLPPAPTASASPPSPCPAIPSPIGRIDPTPTATVTTN